jgi:diguanylate cyclase
MLDIDHFKKLNDAHGHQVGDEVLHSAASSLASSCRDFDTAARYGGEEFAVILPSCSPQESLPAGDRLRAAVAASGASVSITASAGVATYPIHAADPQALIKAADEALYESKRSGRNRVTRSRRRSMTSQTPVNQP